MSTKAKNMVRNMEENHKVLSNKALKLAKKHFDGKMSTSQMLWGLAGAVAVIGAGVTINYLRKRNA